MAWCKKHPLEYQKWLHGFSDSQAHEELEHEDSMEFNLKQYKNKINELKTNHAQILVEGEAAYKKFRSKLEDANFFKDRLKEYEAKIIALVDHGKKFCDEIKNIQKKIIDLYDAVEDGEALITSRLNSAKDRADNCTADEDSVFIKNNYYAAKTAFKIMKAAKDSADKENLELNVKLEQIKKINSELSNHDKHAWKKSRDDHGELIQETEQHLGKLEKGIGNFKEFNEKINKLKKEIIDSKDYYAQYFTEAITEYDVLLGEIEKLTPNYITSIAELDDLYQKHKEAKSALRIPSRANSRILNGPPPLINCISSEKSGEVVEKINEIYYRTFLVLEANQHLQNGCDKKESDTQPPDDPETDTDLGSDETKSNTSTESEASNQIDTSGGLRIAGPSVIYVDNRTAFTATDASGKPYPADSGGFVWKTTMESLMTISSSGNPTGASAFKPGPCMILVKYNGMSAWLDVTIKPKEADTEDSNAAGDENLFSFEGGETVSGEDSSGTDSLFSMEGGETVAEIKTEASSPDEGISLLGETPDREQGTGLAPADQKVNLSQTKPSKETDGSKISGAKLKLRHLSAGNARRFTLTVDRVYFSNWYLHVDIENMTPEMIENKRLHLKASINGHNYYLYNYYTGNKAFSAAIPYKSFGNNKIKVICPGHPELGEIKIDHNLKLEKYSNRGLHKWKEFVSPQSQKLLSQKKRAYKRAVAASKRKLSDIDQSAGEYSKLLVQQALSLCHLGHYDSGYQRLDMALMPLAIRTDIQFSYEKKPNNKLQVNALVLSSS